MIRQSNSCKTNWRGDSGDMIQIRSTPHHCQMIIYHTTLVLFVAFALLALLVQAALQLQTTQRTLQKTYRRATILINKKSTQNNKMSVRK